MNTLYDEDILFLTGNTIYQCFRFILDNTCFKCLSFISNKKEINILGCECRVCTRCLNIMIFDAAGDKIILNAYEKSKPYNFNYNSL